MNPLSQFTVLIERRALKYVFKLMTVLGMVFSLLTGQLAVAAPDNGQARKMSRDLEEAIAAGQTPKARWTRDVNG